MKTELFKIVKTVFLITVCLSMHAVLAQSPQKMSYQAVVRNASNVLVANSPVRIITSIYRTSASGTLVFQDWHLVTTNENGLATLEIGTGTNQFGTFSTINWANGPYFIKTQIDPTGNFSFTIEGFSELLSVPYALFAEKSNPVNPVFQYSQSGNGFASNARNVYVEYPYVSLTVAKTGRYQLTFNGNVNNNNLYSIGNPTYDGNCTVQILNETTANEIFTMEATSIVNYASGLYKYVNLQPSRMIVVNLNQGDVIKVRYFQQVMVGATAPTTNWMMGATGISILKVED